MVRVKENSGIPSISIIIQIGHAEYLEFIGRSSPGQMEEGWAAAEEEYSQLPHVRCFSAYPEVHMQ